MNSLHRYLDTLSPNDRTIALNIIKCLRTGSPYKAKANTRHAKIKTNLVRLIAFMPRLDDNELTSADE